MFPFDVWEIILKSVSLRALGDLQSVNWFLRCAANADFSKRAKLGVGSGKATLYWRVGPHLNRSWGQRKREADRVFRYEQMPGELVRFSGAQVLQRWNVAGRMYSGWCHRWEGLRRPAELQNIFLSFPDTIDQDCSAFCVYKRDDTQRMYPRWGLLSERSFCACEEPRRGNVTLGFCSRNNLKSHRYRNIFKRYS
jgi:hypothetical protein